MVRDVPFRQRRMPIRQGLVQFRHEAAQIRQNSLNGRRAALQDYGQASSNGGERINVSRGNSPNTRR